MDKARQRISRDDLIEVGVCAEGLYEATGKMPINDIDVEKAIALFPEHEVSILRAANMFFAEELAVAVESEDVFATLEFKDEQEKGETEYGYSTDDGDVVGYAYSNGGQVQKGDCFGDGDY